MPKEESVTQNKLKPQPINGQPSGLVHPKKLPMRKILLWTVGIVVAIILGVAASVVIWYNIQLKPVGNDIGKLDKITIASGSTPSQIGKELEKQSIIRSSAAFDIYTRLYGKSNLLQAGTYRLSPAETTPQIVQHIVNGSIDQFSITFYPGATLTDTTDKPKSKKGDVTTVLENAGYSDAEIAAALSKTYSGPLFDGKPSSADLEGYVYGETYNFNTGVTVEEILQRTFDEFYTEIKDNNLVANFSSHDLSLYQGITLASIIQREVSSSIGQKEPTQDQKQVAQVFHSRLAIDMPLGSDVTSIYIAHKTGQKEPDYGLVSPYNTRLSIGLPPGPIAVPGITALLAVAQPAATGYLFFLSGDDGAIHFALNDAGHEANRVNYCKEACK